MIKSIARMTPSDYDRLRDQLQNPSPELVEKLAQRIGEFLSGFRGSSSDEDLIYEVVSELTAADVWKKIPVPKLIPYLKEVNNETRANFHRFLPQGYTHKLIAAENDLKLHGVRLRTIDKTAVSSSTAFTHRVFLEVAGKTFPMGDSARSSRDLEVQIVRAKGGHDEPYVGYKLSQKISSQKISSQKINKNKTKKDDAMMFSETSWVRDFLSRESNK